MRASPTQPLRLLFVRARRMWLFSTLLVLCLFAAPLLAQASPQSRSSNEESLAIARRSLLVSTMSLTLGVFVACFTVFSWRHVYRPIVTARVATHAQGNQGSFLNLVVENTGARPARNIRLAVDQVDLERAFDPDLAETERGAIRACFDEKFRIPVLADHASVSNFFGVHAGDGSVNRSINTWQWHTRLPIQIHYETLAGRRLTTRVDLFLADNSGFASTNWSSEKA